ncbi:hypothetical protein Sango_0009600 [Sesamum angolense]|uniref:Uncharacterized protein n=1 Tax=Sesamum angolense TaxID=2727404 RepID=A0AAE1XD99_9LAMI|nr:hypothetical protein Sango_0009600 [Sesamum angolense]
MTAVVPQVRGLISYYRSRESQSYRPSLRKLPYDYSRESPSPMLLVDTSREALLAALIFEILHVESRFNEKTTYKDHKERYQDVACLMLLSMVPELQKQFKDTEAYDIIIQLKDMFSKAARVKQFETVIAILESRQKDDELAGPYVLRMI